MSRSGTHKPGVTRPYSLLLNISFAVFVLLVIASRVRIYLDVNLFVVDSDQPFMWIGARDYLHGIFTEPRFYGQNYNTFMEALFAVPLLWAGLEVYEALPVVTHFIALFPFLFPAFYLFSKGKKEQALVILCVLLCMTTAYDIITGIPRGFVTGLFFTAFFVLSLHQPQNLSYIALNTIMSVIGYFVHPGSVFVTAPLLFYLFLHHYRHRKYYQVTVVSLFTIIPAHLFFNSFYTEHPEYIVHGLAFTGTTGNFLQNLRHLVSDAFVHLGIFSENTSLPLFAVAVILLIALGLRNRRAAAAFIVFILLLVCSCVWDKTRDGSYSAFYSFSRVFVGVPLALGLFATLLPFRRKAIVFVILGASAIFQVYKQLNFHSSIAPHTDQSRWAGVSHLQLNDALDAIRFYKKVAEEQQVDLILSSNLFWLSTFITYGGPATDEGYPETMETYAEHRYKVREKHMHRVISDFVFLSDDFKIDEKIGHKGFNITRLDHYGLFRISENTLTTQDFIEVIKPVEMKNRGMAY